jgi:dephospho-CoA kinase
VFYLEGGIASGKTTVESFLEPHPVIDADQVSRDVVAPGMPALEQISDLFGDHFIRPDGTLDRAALRQQIASDRDAQQKLNALLHPIIIAEIKRRLQNLAATHAVAFVSAALMLESGSYRNYDGVILVTAPYETRLKRVLSRDGMDETSARALMAKQMPDEEKRKHCDVEIVNDGDLTDLKRKTHLALEQLGFKAS